MFNLMHEGIDTESGGLLEASMCKPLTNVLDRQTFLKTQISGIRIVLTYLNRTSSTNLR